MLVPGRFADEQRSFSGRLLVEMLPGKSRVKRTAIKQLVDLHILKRDKDGTLYVKRVYEDMRLSEIRRLAGSKGGNPLLVGDLVKQTVKQNDKQNTTPSTSTSTSSAKLDNNSVDSKPELGVGLTKKLGNYAS